MMRGQREKSIFGEILHGPFLPFPVVVEPRGLHGEKRSPGIKLRVLRVSRAVALPVSALRAETCFKVGGMICLYEPDRVP